MTDNSYLYRYFVEKSDNEKEDINKKKGGKGTKQRQRNKTTAKEKENE